MSSARGASRTPPQSGLFKFLHRQHGSSVLGGTLLFRRASYFRCLEEQHENHTIGDAFEGMVLNRLTADFPNENPHLLSRVAQNGVVLEGAARLNARFRDVEFYRFCSEHFIFCYCSGDYNDLKRLMCTGPGIKDGYNYCVRLQGTKILEELIRFGCATNMGNRLVDDLFDVYHGPVSYLPREGELNDDRPPEPSIFIKRPESEYIKFNEWRFALKPRGPFDFPEHLFIKVELPDEAWGRNMITEVDDPELRDI